MPTLIPKRAKLAQNLINYSRLVANFRNWWAYLAFRRKHTKGQVITMFTKRSGIHFSLPRPSLQTFKEIFLYQEYVIEPIWGNLPQAPLIVDVGANIGLFSLFCVHCYPNAKVLAVEPFAANFSVLRANCSANANFSILPIKAAVGPLSGRGTLVAEDSESVSVGAYLSDVLIKKSMPINFKEEVEVKPISLLLEENRIDRIDWLKLDCEGAEYSILFNLDADMYSRIGAMTVECHRMGNSHYVPKSIADHLEKQGYEVFEHSGPYGEIVHAFRKNRKFQS